MADGGGIPDRIEAPKFDDYVAPSQPPKSSKTPLNMIFVIPIFVLAGSFFYIGVSVYYYGLSPASYSMGTAPPASSTIAATTTITLENATILSGCHVSRSQPPTLQGQCSGSQPEYVGMFTSSSKASLSSSISTNSSTSSSWFYLKKRFYAASNGGQYGSYSLNLSPGVWYSMVITVGVQPNSSVSTSVYLNGNRIYDGPPGILSALINLSVSGQYYQYISNFQYYNASLSPLQVTTLYNEGIGGLPVDLPHLVAWFPLDNNTYDYSGMGANFSYTSIAFTNNYASR